MPSFSIALTGLEANSVAMNAIGNNLANLNTTAFKDQTATFSALFYQNLGSTGSGDALQVGLGTQVSGTSTDFSQGSLSKTTNSTDMALNGNGFFVLNQGGIQQLTRSGNFQLDQSGNLITTAGDGVMGYAAANGVVNTNTPLTELQVPVAATQAAQATGSFGITANLDAATGIGGTFSSTITMYDSLGTSHAATVNFTKTADNTWDYAISLPAADATGTPANNTGTLTFNSSGALVTPATNVTDITFPGMTDAANDMKFDWNLYNSSGAPQIGQTVGTSTATASTQDGFASGSYQSFSVDSSGVISAAFSNGQTVDIGQLAIASVTNVEGLTLTGGNNYQTTAASGAASVGAPGAGGRGSIEDDTLEVSNVDISTEFANLIVAQRAYEANSKTVTTFDTVTQETINMIR
jgi:flagellar hook protein FlgE